MTLLISSLQNTDESEMVSVSETPPTTPAPPTLHMPSPHFIGSTESRSVFCVHSPIKPLPNPGVEMWAGSPSLGSVGVASSAMGVACSHGNGVLGEVSSEDCTVREASSDSSVVRQASSDGSSVVGEASREPSVVVGGAGSVVAGAGSEDSVVSDDGEGVVEGEAGGEEENATRVPEVKVKQEVKQEEDER